MASLPVEVLYGIYLGLLTGIIPALVSGSLGFLFKYVTGVTLPGLGVVVLSVAIAGVNGGLMGLLDPTVSSSPRLLVAVVVIMMLSLWAHSQGDKLGVSMPKRVTFASLRRRNISADVVDIVGGVGKVTLRPSGPVRDMEGYPPLPADLRETIAEGSWSLPADLPLAELESRLVDRLRTEYDLADAAVTLDTQGRATIAAAPPASGLSRRIPPGKRAVSVTALLPTGAARGDSVVVRTGETRVAGTLLSAKSDGSPAPAPPTPDADDDGGVATDGGTDDVTVPAPTAPTTTGGEGRLTAAVTREQARTLLDVDRAQVAVTSRGTRREFELVSLLRRSGRRFRKVSVRAEGPLDGVTIGDATIRDSYDVTVLALRHPPEANSVDRSWAFSPRGDAELSAGDELFVVGRQPALVAFAEAVA
ncbi:potassium channel family protein [Haloarchaeobius iranensis]|uniref:TrkA-C domain-containing protein n=1 Tax=Haloarchaeobius iranensis TaxID=996166 RepID=A0A1G9ZSK2_9EURY|nr:TrkA C-terminal domain-containing protein [Haloarchaeobius iranensis]SDN24097.1 TrkA-C domain-containing protein [Haloarchaeobius iranensis]